MLTSKSVSYFVSHPFLPLTFSKLNKTCFLGTCADVFEWIFLVKFATWPRWSCQGFQFPSFIHCAFLELITILSVPAPIDRLFAGVFSSPFLTNRDHFHMICFHQEMSRLGLARILSAVSVFPEFLPRLFLFLSLCSFLVPSARYEDLASRFQSIELDSHNFVVVLWIHQIYEPNNFSIITAL